MPSRSILVDTPAAARGCGRWSSSRRMQKDGKRRISNAMCQGTRGTTSMFTNTPVSTMRTGTICILMARTASRAATTTSLTGRNTKNRISSPVQGGCDDFTGDASPPQAGDACVKEQDLVRCNMQSERSVGFTLLELILVMVILSTVLAMAAPSLRGFFASRQIQDAAAQILALTQFARSQAVSEGTTYRLNFDPDEA